jgi:hypothetical protein
VIPADDVAARIEADLRAMHDRSGDRSRRGCRPRASRRSSPGTLASAAIAQASVM